MIKTVLLVFICFFLSSCAVYKVSPVGSTEAIKGKDVVVSLKQSDTKFPEGAHCFEPMLFILTLGIIPTHCIEMYQVLNSSSEEIGTYKVTKMNGWIPLLLIPSSQWKYGFADKVDKDIESKYK